MSRHTLQTDGSPPPIRPGPAPPVQSYDNITDCIPRAVLYIPETVSLTWTAQEDILQNNFYISKMYAPLIGGLRNHEPLSS